MAQVSMYIPDYIAGNNKCPSCRGPIEIVFISDNLIHINCPECTWAQLACAVYHLEPWDIPFAYEEINPVHPH